MLRWQMRHIGVEERYVDSDWARCRVKEQLRSFVKEMPKHVEDGHGLMLLGPPGTGKSSTAALLVREAVKMSVGCRWVYVPDMLDELFDSRARGTALRRQDEVDLLVWDDFGVQQLTSWQTSQLDRIVEHRYRKRRSMIVTTNLTKTQLKSIPEYARLLDRWREVMRGVTIGGDSMRLPWQEGEEDGNEG